MVRITHSEAHTGHRKNSDLEGEETIVPEAICYDGRPEDGERNQVLTADMASRGVMPDETRRKHW